MNSYFIFFNANPSAVQNTYSENWEATSFTKDIIEEIITDNENDEWSIYSNLQYSWNIFQDNDWLLLPPPYLIHTKFFVIQIFMSSNDS